MAVTAVERPAPERLGRLRQVADAHAAWMDEAIPEAPFEPDGRPERSDYNLHNPDIESSGEMEDRFAELVASGPDVASTADCGCPDAAPTVS